MCISTTHLASSTRLGRLSHLHFLSEADLLEDFKLDLVRRSTCWNPIPNWACFTAHRNGTTLVSQGQVKVDLHFRWLTCRKSGTAIDLSGAHTVWTFGSEIRGCMPGMPMPLSLLGSWYCFLLPCNFLGKKKAGKTVLCIGHRVALSSFLWKSKLLN